MPTDIFPASVAVRVGAFTGSTGTEIPVFVAPTDIKILGVDLVDITGVTGHTANYGTATLYNRGLTGSGTTSVAARSTNVATTGTITAKKAWPITLSGTSANLRLTDGQALAFTWTEAGTGQDLGGATLSVHYAIGT